VLGKRHLRHTSNHGRWNGDQIVDDIDDLLSHNQCARYFNATNFFASVADCDESTAKSLAIAVNVQ
jgi:hypothetical protein